MKNSINNTSNCASHPSYVKPDCAAYHLYVTLLVKKHDLNATLLLNLQTFCASGLFYGPSSLSPPHPPQKKKPKLLVHASKER